MGCNNISISLELNFKKSNDLEGRVLIRCTQNRKHKRIGTEVALSLKYWDKIYPKI
jgi:hypothetical protein